jgi:thiol-disulfide isomerase/thioredoxin
MKNLKRLIICIFLLSITSASYAQSEDLFMQIWKAKEEVSLSEKSQERANQFKQDKTDILSKIKQLEDDYYQKLENAVSDEKLKEDILKLYRQKHHLIDEVKSQAIQSYDEALFLELREHIRPNDLSELLKSDKLSKSHRELYKNWFESIRTTAVGSQLKDFVLFDQDGSKVSTLDLKGKIIWIDSWASKCGPCIKKLKQIKPVYEKYHSKGFGIVALSWDYTLKGYMKTLDAARADWLKVMNKHKFSWLNVFDDKDKVMGGQFGSVGKNLMIDEKGIIIGFDLHPLEIEQILKEKL